MKNKLKKVLFAFILSLSLLTFIGCGDDIDAETPYEFFEELNNKEVNPDDESKMNIYAEKLLIETESVKMDFSKSEAELVTKGEDVTGKFYLAGKTNERGLDNYGEISGEYANWQLFYTRYVEDILGNNKYVSEHEISKQDLLSNLDFENLQLVEEDLYDKILNIVNKLTSEVQTSTFVKETYNNIFNLEEIRKQYIITLNYDGIKTYIDGLLNKTLNEHLLKLLDKESIDYDKLIDDIANLTVKKVVEYLNNKNITNDELVEILDKFACLVYEEDTTFAILVKDEFDLDIESDDTKELLANEEFLNLEIGKELITSEEEKEELKDAINSFANSSLLDLMFKDYTVEEYRMIKETLTKEIDLLINILKENLVLEVSYDKDGSFNGSLIEFKYDFSNLFDSEIFEDFAEEKLSVDINIKVSTNKEFSTKDTKFDQDKEFINGLQFKETEVKFVPIDNSDEYNEIKIEPVYKNGILDGIYYYSYQSYLKRTEIAYYPIYSNNVTYLYECDSIFIKLAYLNKPVNYICINTSAYNNIDEACDSAKLIYNAIALSDDYNNEYDEYVIFSSPIIYKKFIYFPDSKEIDANTSYKYSLHNYVLDETQSIYNNDCSKYNYEVYKCENCEESYVKVKYYPHSYKSFGKVDLKKYGIDGFDMNFKGCDMCNLLSTIPYASQNMDYYLYNEEVKYSEETIEGVYWRTIDLYDNGSKKVSIVVESKDNELIVYVNYNKETKTYDEKFTFSGAL